MVGPLWAIKILKWDDIEENLLISFGNAFSLKNLKLKGNLRLNFDHNTLEKSGFTKEREGRRGRDFTKEQRKFFLKKQNKNKNNNKRVLVIYECKSADFSIVCVKYTVRICQDILNLIQLCSFNNSYGICYSGEQWGILL